MSTEDISKGKENQKTQVRHTRDYDQVPLANASGLC